MKRRAPSGARTARLLTIFIALAVPVPAGAQAQQKLSVWEVITPKIERRPWPQVWVFSIAPRVGVTIPTSKLGPMAAAGLELGAAPALIGHRLFLTVDASITRPTHGGSGTDARVGGAYDYEVSVRSLKLAVGLAFRFFTGERPLVPYLGGGVAWQLAKTTASNDLAPGDITESATHRGFELLGGVDYRVGPGRLLGEARYVHVPFVHRLTGDSNLGSVSVGMGYKLVF
jgi:opacity protein-like surface antigen